MSTPYDGKVALWHVEGDVVGEATIDAIAVTVKRYAPVADAIYVKTSDGPAWQGASDGKAAMAVRSAADIARWVATLEGAGLEFHAWCEVRGASVDGEIARIVEASRVQGVRSMIVGVEPYPQVWKARRDDVLRLISGVRNQLGASFHIGLRVDPRQRYYDTIFPDVWRPYVNSIHPLIDWELMRRDPDDVLTEAYVTWGAYGLPIYPVIQAGGSAAGIRAAQDNARSVRGATGLSYFRLGTIGPLQFPVINEELVDEEVGPDRVLRRYGWERIVSPREAGYMDGTQTGAPSDAVFKEFTSVRGQTIRYKTTEPSQDQVWAQWTPGLPAPGIYELSVYVPSRHATTRQARYHIHGVTGAASELLVKLDQSLYNNQWVPLVSYEFSGEQGSGRVNLTDLTGESGLEIAFTAIRWRQVVEQTEPSPEVGNGFDPPIGTAEERLSAEVWPGRWYDATGYASYYTTVGGAYHTGADLNLPADADRNTPVYAPADGVVTFSGRSSGTWGRLIVIRHDPLPDGTVVWSRLAHVTNPIVREGDRVERGQQVASIGNADGKLAWHLHFDIAKTDVLERNPGHWPGPNLSGVRNNYLDPRDFVARNRPPGRG
jgi:murein DD-endopeptidase MepM/ murein hydrolase activator NlpD